MKQIDRTKVCWNCEADVSHQATYCPFCGTDLLDGDTPAQGPPPKQDHKFADQTLQESLASLYKPPYSVRNRQGLGIPDEREEIPYVEQAEEEPLPPSPSVAGEEFSQLAAGEISPYEERGEAARPGSILPLLFLMIGAHLLALGALLLFCAKDGVVTLEWSSRFWPLYWLISAPLLYFGAKLLKKSP